MKKLLTAIALIACLVLPLSAMAMTTIADNELSTVTGQSGVSINVNVTANLAIGDIAWGDVDGAAGFGYANAGFVGLSAMNLTVHISGRHDGPFANTTAGAGYLLGKPITIDVGTNTSGATIVAIGLPTVEVIMSSLDTDIFLSGATAGAPTSTTAQQLGHIYIGGLTVLMGQTTTPAIASTYDPGYVTIGAAGAGNTGVNIGFNVKIDTLAIGVLSYGNTTSILAGSFGGAATGGFVGISGLNLVNVTATGGVAIGVGTLNGALLGTPVFGTQTQVSLIFANGTTISSPGAIYGTVLLAQDKALSVGVGQLGNFYIGGITAQLVDNVGSFAPHSLVQIWAH
jgi:hypothetical protein